MAAVGFATVDLGKKNVYIIGMDFYDVGYLADGGPGGPESGYRMKDSLNRIIDSKKEIKFTVITCGDYENNKNKDNLEVIKLEEIQ